MPHAAAPLRWLARRRAWWLEVVTVLIFYGAYESTRGLAPAVRDVAFANAHNLLSFERSIDLDPERALNSALASSNWLGMIASYYYVVLHFAVTIIVLIALYIWRPRLYARSRNTLVLASYAALLVFWFAPVAPPRLAESGIVDVVVQHHAIGSMQESGGGLENIYAAMPSLHVGWAVWAALVAIRAGRRLWRHLAWLYPVATSVVVLATGNHYLLDVVAGAALIFAVDGSIALVAVIVTRRSAALRSSASRRTWTVPTPTRSSPVASTSRPAPRDSPRAPRW